MHTKFLSFTILFFLLTSGKIYGQSYDVILNAIQAKKKQIPKEDEYVLKEWLVPCLMFYKEYKSGMYRRYRRSEVQRLFAKAVAKTVIIPGRTSPKDPKADKHTKKLNEFKENYLIANKPYTYHVIIIDFISFYGKKMGISNKFLGGRIPYNDYYRRNRILPNYCEYLNRIRKIWDKLSMDDKEKLKSYGIDAFLIDRLKEENPKCIYRAAAEEKKDCQQVEQDFAVALLEATQGNNARPLEEYFDANNCYKFINQSCLDTRAFSNEISDILSNYYSAYFNDNQACCKEREHYLEAAYSIYFKNPEGFEKTIAQKYNKGQPFNMAGKMANLQKLLEKSCPDIVTHKPYQDAEKKIAKVKNINDIISKDLKRISEDLINMNKKDLIKAGLPDGIAEILNCYEEEIKQDNKGFEVNFRIQDCENYSTVIQDYGLGVVVSPHAQVLATLSTTLLKVLKEKGNIDLSQIIVEVTGLADASKCAKCPSGQEIAVRYSDSKKVNIALKPIVNFSFYKKDTEKQSVINFKKGDIIKTNLDLAAVRAHQVETEFEKLNLETTIKYYAQVSSKANYASSRGVQINLKLPDAYKDILNSSDLTVESIVNYLLGQMNQ